MMRETGNSRGPNNTTEGIPSRKLPRMTKATTVTVRNPARPGHAGHQPHEGLREPRLGERPRHRRGRRDDQEDRPRQRRRFHEHRVDPPPVESGDRRHADDRRIGDPDGGHLGRRRHPLDHGPSTRNGSGGPGNGDEKLLQDRGSCGRAAPRSRAPDRAKTMAAMAAGHGRREQAAINRAAIDTPATDPMSPPDSAGPSTPMAPDAESVPTAPPDPGRGAPSRERPRGRPWPCRGLGAGIPETKYMATSRT